MEAAPPAPADDPAAAAAPAAEPVAAPAAAPASAPTAEPAPAPAPLESSAPTKADALAEARAALPKRLQKLDADVQRDPYDGDAWLALLAELSARHPDVAGPYFERCIAIFPTGGRVWSMYAEMELRLRRYDRLERVFERCLRSCLYVDVWRTYLSYVREVQWEGKQTTDGAADIVKRAYEFALEHVGNDIASGVIWTDYLAFLKALPTRNSYEEQVQTATVRRIYHLAITNPMHGIEEVWRSYDQYEHALNKQLAAKMIQERSAAYMTARTSYRERRGLMEQVNRYALARPPRGIPVEEQQLHAWLGVLKFEKRNTLKADDGGVARTLFAYRQCLSHLRYYPEIWHDAAMYLQERGRLDEAAKMYHDGMSALPHCLVLHFACAEFEELRKNVSEGRAVYEKLLANCQQRADSVLADAPGEAGKTPAELELEAQRATHDLSLVFIMLMRYFRRNTAAAEDPAVQGMRGVRAVFSRARKLPRCTYHVYVASALMELLHSKDPEVARKIFDLGFTKFAATHPPFVLEYLQFLMHLHDENNLRAFFERVLQTVPATQADYIWQRYLDFELHYGDLQSMARLEKRRADALGDTPVPWKSLVERYTYRDLLPCSEADLRSMGMRMRAMVTEMGTTLSALGYAVPAETTARLPLPASAYGDGSRPPAPTTLHIAPPPPSSTKASAPAASADPRRTPPPAEELLAAVAVAGARMPNLASLTRYRPEAAVPVPVALAPPVALALPTGKEPIFGPRLPPPAISFLLERLPPPHQFVAKRRGREEPEPDGRGDVQRPPKNDVFRTRRKLNA